MDDSYGQKVGPTSRCTQYDAPNVQLETNERANDGPNAQG